MKTWKTAVFGTGFMGRVHLEAIRRLGNVDVVALASLQGEVAKKLAAQFGVGRVESNYRKLLEDPSIDAVHICTPNNQHFPMAQEALQAGKHVVCEKPLARDVAEAQGLVAAAAKSGRRDCLNHNLRYYPLVQQIRRMCEAGELGDILVVQGTYSQDWLLYDTDYNWRVEGEHGASRTFADIGSHWFDMAEHVTGQRVTSLCADFQTFYKTRKRPKGTVETFGGKLLPPDQYDEVPISTEDYCGVIFRMGERTRGVMTVSQVSAGRKNRLSLEVYGTKGGAAWDQERPNELWLGNRNANNQLLVKDPSLLLPGAQSYADQPGGHAEGYGDTFKQNFKRFYASLEDAGAETPYPRFRDGLRQLTILQAALDSQKSRAWVDVPAAEGGQS
ncbi:MAG TPA: Gfo/Idh/MocA family oxidoreductase [Bryobacteraceae bacterium]|jgi:predicted dehydrogenase|nr:Gfo/Idh/MocA family oxidoreductase [Bryobacteraceae bacterium]